MKPDQVRTEDGEQVVGIFKAVFLGAIPLNLPKGVRINDYEVTLCFREVNSLNQLPKKVLLAVSSEKVSIIGRKTHNLLQKTPITHLKYTGLLERDPSKFSYVSNDPEIGITMCHMFSIKDKSSGLPDAVAAAHDLHKQKHGDSISNSSATDGSVADPEGEGADDVSQAKRISNPTSPSTSSSDPASNDTTADAKHSSGDEHTESTSVQTRQQDEARRSSRSLKSLFSRTQSSSGPKHSSSSSNQDPSKGTVALENGNEQSLGTFVARLLVEDVVKATPQSRRNDVERLVRRAIDALSKKSKKKLAGEGILLSISNESVRTIDRQSNRVVDNMFIRDIIYTTSGDLDKKREFFSYIVRNERLDVNKCLVFEVEFGKGATLCKLVAKAFASFAAEVRNAQSFAKKREDEEKAGNSQQEQQQQQGTNVPDLAVTVAAQKKRRGTASEQDKQILRDSGSVAFLPLELEPLQLERDSLIALKVLGCGVYGKVYLADQVLENGEKVQRAVKLLRGKATNKEKAAFIREVQTMNVLRHDYIVSVVGINATEHPWLCVLEFMQYGDLQATLQALRAKNFTLFDTESLLFALQIVHGMQYLTEKGYVHMDLAARNCLLHRGNSVKIADFGLTRAYDDGKPHWTMRETLRLAVKWLPPDALKTKKFNEKTDVWSFGVVLWEIMSLGEVPFKELPVPEVPTRVLKGLRLVKPERCSDDLYALMKRCWAKSPSDRVTFRELAVELSQGLAVAKHHFPPARDVGELVNQKLSDEVRRLSVSTHKRAEKSKSQSHPTNSAVEGAPAPAPAPADTKVLGDVSEEPSEQATDASAPSSTEETAETLSHSEQQQQQEEVDESAAEPETRIRLSSVSTHVKRKQPSTQPQQGDSSSKSSEKGSPSAEGEEAATVVSSPPLDEGGDDNDNEDEAAIGSVKIEGVLVPADTPMDEDEEELTSNVDVNQQRKLLRSTSELVAPQTGNASPATVTSSTAMEEIKEADEETEKDEEHVGNEESSDATKEAAARTDDPAVNNQEEELQEEKEEVTATKEEEVSQKDPSTSSSTSPVSEDASTLDATPASDAAAEQKKKDAESAVAESANVDSTAHSKGVDDEEAKRRERYRRLGLSLDGDDGGDGSNGGKSADQASQSSGEVKRSKIFQALNPTLLYQEQGNTGGKTHIVPGASRGLKSTLDPADESNYDNNDYNDDGGNEDDYDNADYNEDDNPYEDADAIGSGDDDEDEDDDEDDFDGDISSLPGFEDLQMYLEKRNAAHEAEHMARMEYLRVKHSRIKEAEEKEREYILQKISRQKEEEREEKEKQKAMVVQESQERLKDIRFSFSFDGDTDA